MDIPLPKEGSKEDSDSSGKYRRDNNKRRGQRYDDGSSRRPYDGRSSRRHFKNMQDQNYHRKRYQNNFYPDPYQSGSNFHGGPQGNFPNFQGGPGPGGFPNFPGDYSDYQNNCQNFQGNYNMDQNYDMQQGNGCGGPPPMYQQPNPPGDATNMPPNFPPDPSFQGYYPPNTMNTFPPVNPLGITPADNLDASLAPPPMSLNIPDVSLPPVPPPLLEALPLGIEIPLPQNPKENEKEKEEKVETEKEEKETKEENLTEDISKADGEKSTATELPKDGDELNIESISTPKLDSTSVEKEKEPVLNPLALAIQKQQIEILKAYELKESTVKPEVSPEKPTIPKKLNLPCLGKEAAKKRLKSFTASTFFAKDKSKLGLTNPLKEDAGNKEKTSIKESTEDEKKESLKKKKRKEKMSVIEQIRNEETRLKEAFNFSSTFNPFGSGYKPEDINNILNNPEVLKKMEAKGIEFKERIEKGQLGKERIDKGQVSSPASKRSDRRSREREREKSRPSLHDKDSSSNRDKNRDRRDNSSKRTVSRDSDRKKESKSSSSKTPELSKPKIKQLPKNWKEMKSLNMTFSDIRNCLKYQRSRSQSPSVSPGRSSRDKRDPKNYKNYPFPQFPKQFQSVKVNNALNYGTVEYRGSMVQHTLTKPSISYSICPTKYKHHYWSRKELRMRNKHTPEIIDIVDQFLKSESSVKERKHPKRSSRWFVEDWLSENLSEDESKDGEGKKITALDYLSSNYKTELISEFESEADALPVKVEETEIKVDEVKSTDKLTPKKSSATKKSKSSEHKPSPLDDISSHLDKKSRSSDHPSDKPPIEEISKFSKSDSFEEEPTLDKPISSDYKLETDTKLSTQELNEEYEAFINTLEYKPDDSSGFSEDTLDFNSSTCDDSQTFVKESPKEKAEWSDLNDSQNQWKKEGSSEEAQNTSTKDIKQLLQDPKVSKKEKKEMKKLKKKMKKEKKEKKRVKKELKKKKKAERKLKKKQDRRALRVKKEYEEMEEGGEQNLESREVLEPANNNENMDQYEVVDWEEYNEDSLSADLKSVAEKGRTQSPYIKEISPISQESMQNSNSSYTDTSGFFETSNSTRSITDTNSVSLSPYKPTEETSVDNYYPEDDMPDTYSPSNMSVCSVESSSNNKISSPYSPPSPEQYIPGETEQNLPQSPYSPSSPQSSNSDLAEQEGTSLIPALDTIPMPPPVSLSACQTPLVENSPPQLSTTQSSTVKEEEGDKENLENSTKTSIPAAENATPESEETSLFKKTFQPVTFRLGSSKQSVGLKLLQKAPLPGFSHTEDEDRRSPMFDTEESSPFGKMEKMKSLPEKKSVADPLKEAKIKEEAKKVDPSSSRSESETEKGTSKSSSSKSSSQKESPKDKSTKSSGSGTRVKEEDEDRKSSKSKSSSKETEKGDRREKDHRASDKTKSESKSSSSRSSERRGSYSPKRRDRKRESSVEGKRKRYSRSPVSQRHSQRGYDSKGSFSESGSGGERRSAKSRSRSPANRAEPPRSPPYQRRATPDRAATKPRSSRSQSPASKWKRVKSPPPKKYRDSPEWEQGQEDRPRYASREEDRSRSAYSPRSTRRKSHPRWSKSPERPKSPSYESKKAPKPPPSKDYEFSGQPIDSISNLFQSREGSGNWDWEPSGDLNYPGEDSSSSRGVVNEARKRSLSPDLSPKRLSLDERLKQEHGVEIETPPPIVHPEYPRQQGYYWEFNPPPSQPPPLSAQSAPGKPQVIRVGNVLQVLPQESSPEKPPPPSPHHLYEDLPPQPPKIVQAGNVIQVVPTDHFQVPLRTDAPSEGIHLPPPGMSPSMNPPPASPVPPPTSTATSNPLAFISSLLASSMSQPLGLTESSPATGGEPQSPLRESPSPAKPPPPAGEGEQEAIAPLDSQQQQAIISAAVAAAASGVTASNLPIAHLISVLQQQSLLSQPLAPSSTPTPPRPPSPPTESAPPQPGGKAKIDLETFKKQRRERKERKRREREARRKARREKAMRKRLEMMERKIEEEIEEMQDEDDEEEEEERAKEEVKDDSFDEDDAVIKEAITEVPELGSPIPEYEVYNEDDEEEDEEEKTYAPLPSPPEKGILIGPTFRILRSIQRKFVSFADGINPGDGTSPSGGEEIHSPPPPTAKPEKKEKKLRKKKKVKVKIIKQYILGNTRMDSPPPPPDTPPSAGVLKLYPGCTHYTCTAPGTFVIYTQQPPKLNGNAGLGGGSVTIPPGMLIHSSALCKSLAPGTPLESMGTTIPPSMPHSYPGYSLPPFFGDTPPAGETNINVPILQSPLA